MGGFFTTESSGSAILLPQGDEAHAHQAQPGQDNRRGLGDRNEEISHPKVARAAHDQGVVWIKRCISRILVSLVGKERAIVISAETEDAGK